MSDQSGLGASHHSRKCICGAMNEPDRQRCRACGQPLQATPLAPPPPKRSHSLRNSVLAAILIGLAFAGFRGMQGYLDAQVNEVNRLSAETAQRTHELNQLRWAAQSAPEPVSITPQPQLPTSPLPSPKTNAEPEQSKPSPSVAEVVARARDHLRRREFDQGLALVGEALKAGEDPELLEIRVDLLNNSGRWNEAYACLQRLLTLKPDVGYLHVAAGNFAIRLTSASEALDHFRKAARCEPKNSGYQITFASLAIRQGKLEEGTEVFVSLIGKDPGCLECWQGFANALNAADLPDRAANVLRQAANLNPNHYRYHFDLASILDQWGTKTGDQNRLHEAAAQYLKSLELRPMPSSVAARRYHQITGKRVPAELETAAGVAEIPLRRSGKVHLLPVSINGIEGVFVLDTGASYTCVFTDVAAKYQLKDSGRTAEARTANGAIQAPIAFGRVEAGRREQRRASILLLPEREGRDDETDGLLGMDFLEKYDWQIDTAARKLILRGYSGK